MDGISWFVDLWLTIELLMELTNALYDFRSYLGYFVVFVKHTVVARGFYVVSN